MEDKLLKNVEIDEKNGKEISATFVIYKAASVVYFSWAIFAVIRNILELKINLPKSYATYWSNFVFKIYPFLCLIEIVFGFINMYLFYAAFRMQKKAVIFSDSLLFAKSYRMFRIGSALSIFLSLVALGTEIIFYFGRKYE